MHSSNSNKRSKKTVEKTVKSSKKVSETPSATSLSNIITSKRIESFEGWKNDKSHQIFVFQPRIVSINSKLLAQFEIKFFDGKIFVIYKNCNKSL